MPDKTSTGYAIVDVGGRQYRVAAGQQLKVPHTGGEAGGNLQLERVLMLKENGATHFGSPTVEGATVDATLLGHGRERKIIVFKLRRRKGYRRKAGHRQDYSLLRINGINLAKLKPVSEETGQAIPKTAAKAKPAAEREAAAEKSTTAMKATPAKKTGTAKKSTGAAKATAAKKSTAAKKTSAAKKSTTTEKSAETKKSTSAKKSTSTAKKPVTKPTTKKKTKGS